MTYFATIFVIALSFGLTYAINMLKITNPTNRSISWMTSIIILVLNYVLAKVVTTLSVKERHETLTAYNLSVAFKLTLTQFINTAIIPLMVNISSDKWFIEGGLVTDIFSIMISLSFEQPVL